MVSEDILARNFCSLYKLGRPVASDEDALQFEFEGLPVHRHDRYDLAYVRGHCFCLKIYIGGISSGSIGLAVVKRVAKVSIVSIRTG